MTRTQTCKNWNEVIFALEINQSGENKGSESCSKDERQERKNLEVQDLLLQTLAVILSHIFLLFFVMQIFVFSKTCWFGIRKIHNVACGDSPMLGYLYKVFQCLI